MRFRRSLTMLAVSSAFAIVCSAVPATASPATASIRAASGDVSTSCPLGVDPSWSNCISGPTVITESPTTGLGAGWMVEDYEGHVPGHNAPMAWVDGLQLGSVNPVCADATFPFAAHSACLGGPPFGTGGHALVSLCLRMGAKDCAQWEVLTASRLAQLINLQNAMQAAGITPRDLLLLGRWLHATGR